MRGLPSLSRDRHAARVVDEDAQEVLLRYRRLEDEQRTEQAEEQHRDDAEAQRDQDRAVARLIALAGETAVGDERTTSHGGGCKQHQHSGSRHREPEIALLEDERRILEKRWNSQPITMPVRLVAFYFTSLR